MSIGEIAVEDVLPRKTVLLTGASGQIGTILRNDLRRIGYRVICLSGSGSSGQDLADRWIPWDLETSLAPPSLGEPVNVLVHLGAQTSAYVARESPKRDLLANVGRFVALLENLVESGNDPFVILAGTATQAGADAEWLVDDTRVSPETFYDVAKTAAELYLQQFVREGWISGAILRLSNVYGATSAPSRDRAFLTRAMQRALRGDPIEVFDRCDGHRDYLYVCTLLGHAEGEATNSSESVDSNFNLAHLYVFFL